jgi:hypothetical protein
VSKALRFTLLLPNEPDDTNSNKVKKISDEFNIMQLSADAGYYLSNIYDRAAVGRVYRTAVEVLEAKMQELYDSHQYRLYSAVSELHESLLRDGGKLNEDQTTATIYNARSGQLLNYWYAEHVETGDLIHDELATLFTTSW